MADHPIGAMTTEPDRLAAEQDRLTAELRAWADKEAATCTCGSGGHPRPCDVHPDRYAAHCAELSAEAAYDELQELLSALAVPSHADPLVLVQAIRRVEAVARDWSDDANSRCLGTHNEALAEAVAALAALRTPPRALPTEDGPGVQFWGAWCGGDMRAVDVVMRRGERYGRTLGLGGLEWEPIDDERWTWLSTPDGKAVRCEPPEVTRG